MAETFFHRAQLAFGDLPCAKPQSKQAFKESHESPHSSGRLVGKIQDSTTEIPVAGPRAESCGADATVDPKALMGVDVNGLHEYIIVAHMPIEDSKFCDV